MEETPKQDMHRILITEIIKNTELTLIFNKLLNPDYSYSDLFLINKDQIFPDGESGRNYYLLWNNLHNNIEYPENENFSDILEGFLGSSILKTKVELQLIKESQFFGLLINIFLQSPNEFQTDCKDLFFYYLIKFVNQNNDLKKLITENDFSFYKMKKIMKDYSSISSQVIDIMNKIKEFDDISYEDLNDDDKLIHSKIKKVIPEFQKYIIENPLTAQYFINDQFNQLYTPHFIGINHLDNLLSDIEINDDDYMNIITELYTLKLIRNVHTIFWCENCRDEQQFLQSFSNTDPNHSTLECPKCKSDMFCSSIYELHQILLNSILYKDGILSIYLGWLLTLNGIKYEFNTYENGKFEKDFIIKNKNKKILVECKMHKTNKDRENVLGGLIKDSIQCFDHVKEIDDIDKTFILCNYDLEGYDDILTDVYNNEKIKTEMKKYPFEIISHWEINNIIEELES